MEKEAHTLGELRRATRASYSDCIFVIRFESRWTSAETSTMSARGRYASKPSPATRWTACLA